MTHDAPRTYSDELVSLIDKTVIALRSGDFEQAKGQLRLHGTAFAKEDAGMTRACHCCLGVACEVSDYGSFDDGDYFNITADLTEQPVYDHDEYVKSHGVLPELMSKYLDVKDELTVAAFTAEGVTYLGGLLELLERPLMHSGIPPVGMSRLNDGGVGFGPIADVLERAKNFDGIAFLQHQDCSDDNPWYEVDEWGY